MGTQVTIMKTITGIQLYEPSVLDNYTNHSYIKELGNGHLNANMASSQILENIFQLYIKPIGRRHVENVITIYIYIRKGSRIGQANRERERAPTTGVVCGNCQVPVKERFELWGIGDARQRYKDINTGKTKPKQKS